MSQEKECVRSPTRDHEWVYPRLEDSIDKNRQEIEPYCKYCFEKAKIIQMEKRKCPYCQEQIEVVETGDNNKRKFISHRRSKNNFDDEDNSEGNVHCRNFSTTVCEGSESVIENGNSQLTQSCDDFQGIH